MRNVLSLMLSVLVVVVSAASADAGHHHGGRHRQRKHHKHTAINLPNAQTMIAAISPSATIC
jgi:membrane protein required for beta-lactamase induction